MRRLLLGATGLAALWLLPGHAHAQPTCQGSPNNGQIPCYPRAVNPQPTDVVLGAQQTGPNTPNQTTTFTLQQVTAAGTNGASGAFLDASLAPYNVVCDGSTDTTAALQAAVTAGDLNHLDKRVVLPSGDCRFTGVTVHAPVTVQCAGRNATKLDLIPGTANALVTVAITSTDLPSAPAGGFVYVDFVECQLTAPSNADGPGQGTAHGFYVKGLTSPTPATVVVEMVRDKIAGVPGDCVHYDQTGSGLSWKGNFKGEGSTCEQPGGNGLSCNSGSDWQWWEGQVWGATLNNFQFSGCTNMQMHGINTFSALLADISLFNSDMQWAGGIIDLTGQHNIIINNTGGQPVDIIGAWLRWPGQTATNTYSNFRFTATNTGNVYCTGCRIQSPGSALPNGNTALNVAQFVAGNTGQLIVDGSSRVEGHDWTDAAVSNNTDMINMGTGTQTFPTMVRIQSNSQFDGFLLRQQATPGIGNTWTPVAKLYGSTSTNDGGSLALYNANVLHGSVTVNGSSFVSNFAASPTALAGTVGQGEIGLQKVAPSGTAPGAGGLKLSAVAGTTGGTCKIIAYAGTSTTPVTIIDNVGTGC